MSHELDRTIVHLPVSALRDNPRNNCVHADFDPQGRDSWLIENIRLHGILTPLLVFPDYTLNDGHRRRNVAKRLGLPTVPCVVLQSTDLNAAFTSAQLHRQMSLFAKCVLYRDKIAALVQRAAHVRNAHLNQNVASGEGRGDSDLVRQEWVQTEEVLGVSRRALMDGVKLLTALEELSKNPNVEERHRAARVIQVFRNRGLAPALRLFGESAEPPADDGGEPDVIQWHADDGEPAATKRRRPRRAKKRAAPKEGVPKGRPPGSWRRDAMRAIEQVRCVLQQHGAYSLAAMRAVEVLENEITSFKRKAARAA